MISEIIGTSFWDGVFYGAMIVLGITGGIVWFLGCREKWRDDE